MQSRFVKGDSCFAECTAGESVRCACKGVSLVATSDEAYAASTAPTFREKLDQKLLWLGCSENRSPAGAFRALGL